MELRQLEYFVTVARTLNFSEASRKLFITQGTISQQIMQLENELGSKLFLRSPRSVSLTEAGEELLPLAERTLEDSGICLKKMQDLKNALCGTLNIGLTHSFGSLLTGTVREFIKAYPEVKLNIHYGTAMELIEMLHGKKSDFILAFKPLAAYEKMESEVLFSTRMCAIMRKEHPLAGRRSITPEELERQSIVLPGSGLQARRTLERFIDIDTSRLNVKVEINEPNIILGLLRSTDMVSILSSLAVSYMPSLTAVPIEGFNREMPCCVHYLKDAYHKQAALKFIAMLRDSAIVERIRTEI